MAAAKQKQLVESEQQEQPMAAFDDDEDAAEDAADDAEGDDDQLAGINAMRLEAIKYQILTKLGLAAKPNISNELPKRVVLDTLSRAEQSSAVVQQMVVDETSGGSGGVHQHDMHAGQHRYTMAMTEDGRTNDTQSYYYGSAGMPRGDAYYMYSSGGVGGGGDSTEDGQSGGSPAPSPPSRWQKEQEQEEPHMQQHHDQQPPDDDFFGQTREIITFAEKGELIQNNPKFRTS